MRILSHGQLITGLTRAWLGGFGELANFQYVSNGKAKVASAITDKGIATALDATFEIMANNIRNLKIMPSIEYTIFENYNGLNTSNANDGSSCWNSGGWFEIGKQAKRNFFVAGYSIYSYNAGIVEGVYFKQGGIHLEPDNSKYNKSFTFTRSGTRLSFPQYVIHSTNPSGSQSDYTTMIVLDYD